MAARRMVLGLLVAGLAIPAPGAAWDVICETVPGSECRDPFARTRTLWREHPRAEHRALLDRSLEIAGLPAVLRQPFSVTTFTSDEPLTGPDGTPYISIRPVEIEPDRRRVRDLSIPSFANLPDFSYTLWDFAAGNEACPPDPSNDDPLDCHNYETHIGWLNANHMLPQARRWYEHLHAIALELATECRTTGESIPPGLRERYEPFVTSCEKQALMVEAVGHHYLQDAWAMGHMWERWGGTEMADFGGDRGLGFAVAAFTGLVHGAKAVFDDTPGFSLLGPWDDPMCGPHPNVAYVDAGAMAPGAGDRFIDALNGDGPAAAGDRFGPQRRALFGCAVDGLRAVYGATARAHGPLADPQFAEFDLSRSVADDTCWGQRATNRAIAEGCGVHRGAAPGAARFLPDADALVQDPAPFQPLIMAQITVAPAVAGAPLLDPITAARFSLDASFACALAIAKASDPAHADRTDLAAGGLPALAGIRPNSAYARGNAAARVAPAFYADPFPPWSLDDPDPAAAERKEALHLMFAFANARQRCREFSAGDLEAYRFAVQFAKDTSQSASVIDARCGQCIQMLEPHLRHGIDGNHDARREALCALLEPGSAFVYTGENPSDFTGTEPVGFTALAAATREYCGCEDPPPPTTTTAPSVTSTITVTTTVTSVTATTFPCFCEPPLACCAGTFCCF